MSRTKRMLFAVVVAGLVLAVVELLSRGTYRVLFGQAYGSSHLAQLARPMEWERMVARTAGPNWMRREILHPYLGYVRDSGEAASHGFLTDALLPDEDPDRPIVGIAGGSVAAQLTPQLERLFREHLAETEGGVDPIFVRLGLPGYKQPQQLLAVNYLLALGGRLDLLINVDGYNEVVLPIRDNYVYHTFPFFPRRWKMRLHVRSGVSDLALVARIQSLREEQEHLLAQSRSSRWRHSGGFGLFQAWRITSLARRALATERELAAVSERGGFEAEGPYREFENLSELYAEAAQVWLRSSLVLDRISAGLGIRYHHFLQPNQHLEGSKPLTEEERERAESAGTARYAREGYPHLIEAGRQLRAQGVKFHDLTLLFRDHPETLYVDGCCHLNERGVELLAGRIFELVVQESRPGAPARASQPLPAEATPAE